MYACKSEGCIKIEPSSGLGFGSAVTAKITSLVPKEIPSSPGLCKSNPIKLHGLSPEKANISHSEENPYFLHQ